MPLFTNRPPLPPGARRVALVVLGVLLLALGSRALALLVARFTVPTRSAQWIWETRDRHDLAPAAFYAARDFTLEAPPARARLLVSGDEEYILYLNGVRIGAGAWRPGAPLDVWEVGPLLQPGSNRLLAEVRSDRGTGGFLLSLQDETSGRQLVRTDGTWRVFHQHQLGVLRGWLPLDGDSIPATAWGLPPLGRWGRPRLGPVHPLFSELTRGRPIPAASATTLPGLAGFPPERPQPPLRLFDWGREVTGYLLIDVQPSKKMGVGLLYTGMKTPEPLAERPASGLLVLGGRRTWMDAHCRRFRYALVVGLPGAVAARVQEVDPVRGMESAEGAARGVMGIVPPPLRTPVEDEVWRDLEGVPGVAGRKER
jgi:hypothetical protein